MKTAPTLLCLAFCFAPGVFAGEAGLDTGRIEQLTGLRGTFNPAEHVFKVSFPRADIEATVAGARMIPDLGLTAWAAFAADGDHTILMGDIVLLESEVNPVMSAALDSGIEVTALHNHFLWDSPRVMFMHIGGMGDEQTLARAVGRVFGELKQVIATKPPMPMANIDPAKSSFSPNGIERILGTRGAFKNGVYKVVFGRSAKMGGDEIGKDMGVNTWAAFAGSEQLALVDGDFAMLEGELQEVLKALRAANINIVAIHNHMIGESPRYVFLHYWGVGPVQDLARGVKSALNIQAAY
ncbi:MAG: DUF1259 domain-containing protein [Gammaproteobacteria bacterium]|nr:DUF1259 domain-containing protein [Gammaproteobacteria bacterium]